MFGTDIHPDLAKLQCEQGALFSYREAQSNLEKLNYFQRSVNNHTQVKRITDKVGALLSESNLLPPTADECTPATRTLIVKVDGGHIPIQEKDKRSFEALYIKCQLFSHVSDNCFGIGINQFRNS